MPSMSTRIQIASDIHMEARPWTYRAAEADITVLAGDLIPFPRAHQVLPGFFRSLPERPTIIVLGNHDRWGCQVDLVVPHWRELIRQSGRQDIHLLDDEWLDIGDLRVVGSTLWSDLQLYQDRELPEVTWRNVLRGAMDFQMIPGFTIQEFLRRHQQGRDVIRQAKQGHDRVVVVTHFVPCPEGINPRWVGNPLNPYFTSDARDLMDERVKLFISGHTHDSYDVVVNGVRCVCNPRGYHKGENPAWDRQLVVEIP